MWVFLAYINFQGIAHSPLFANQLTLALLQELLMALRANDADGYKSWLALGIEELGKEIAA